uniref:Tudor domain containing 15 n=1 Tax=Seriola dumerili TaxID=41447 RepID=A0A3B4TIF4_SERDU
KASTLIHFQGQYLTICELDYNILQGEIQNIPKTEAAVDIGEFCLVEDLASARWYRGRVQNQKEDLFDVFLIDHGNVLSVDIAHISSCSNDLFILPPKIVCGFLANVLLLQSCSHSVVEQYFSSLIGKDVTGYIQALLPHKVLLLEAPDINNDLVRHAFGRHVDTDTFLLLVEMLTEVPLKQHVDPVPDLLIEKSRGQEFCFKPSGLQGYEDILSFCGPRLHCGTRAKVRVTAAVNPGLFYCQMASMETELWEMSKALAAVCEYRSKASNQKTPENLGLLCSVKGKDGKWYRGFVQFLPINSQVRVLFIDYGFFESVKVENVHRLPPNLYSTPIMAFPCSLSSLSDQDEAVKTQQLSFLKAGLLGGVLDMEIGSFDEKQHLYSITLFGAEDNCVKELEPIPELPTMEVESVIETEEFSPQGGYLCPRYSVTSDISGNTEELDDNEEEENTHKNEISKAQAPSSFKALCIKPGCEFAVHCSYINSPSDFWCQPQDKVPVLEELMDEVQQYYSTNTVPLQSGVSCCVAKSPQDGRWYRAFITERHKGNARVMLVDYGPTIQIKEPSLKAIMPEYVSLEGQAFRCSFSKLIEPTDSKNREDWNLEVCNSVKAFIRNSTHSLRCKVVSQLNVKNKGLCHVVDLYNTETQQSVANWLVEQGLAREATVSTKQLSTVSPESFVYSSYDVSPENEEQVFVTHVSSQWEVYCHLERNTEIIEELEKKILGESEKMMQASTRPVVRKLCLAKYFDGKWYRGLAHVVQSPLHLSVFFVDYGNTNISEKTHVMFIPRDSADLLYTPMQAVRCCLVSVSKEDLYADVKEWLDRAILNKQVKVVIRGKNEDGSFDVELFDGDVNINEKVKELILKDEPAILKMGDDLNSNILKNSLKTTTSLRINDLVLAEYEEDGALYRSVVKDYEGNSSFKVEFIDYGNSGVVGKENIFLIPKEYLSQPRFSISCSLLDTSAYENDASFTDAVMEKPLMVDFVCQYGNRWEVKVEILDGAIVVKEDVKQGLKCIVQVQKDNKWQRAVVQHVGGEKCKVVLVDHGITQEIPSDLIRQQCGDLTKIPNLAVLCKMNLVRFSEGEDTHKLWRKTLKPMIGKEVTLVFVCFSEADNLWMVEIVMNGLLQQNEEMVLSPAETQNKATVEEPNFDTNPPQQLAFAPIDIDKVYYGFAAAVTTPFEFCVVLEDLLLIMNKVSIMLDDLCGQMSPLPEAHLVHGSCCLLKSDSKNKWCRCEIVHADTTVLVNLVDYGHYECIPYKDHSKLKRLPEELMKLPKVTYPCILRGVKPVEVDEQWNDEAAVFFQQCLYQKNLQIFFREFVSNTYWKVDILADVSVRKVYLTYFVYCVKKIFLHILLPAFTKYWLLFISNFGTGFLQFKINKLVIGVESTDMQYSRVEGQKNIVFMSCIVKRKIESNQIRKNH